MRFPRKTLSLLIACACCFASGAGIALAQEKEKTMTPLAGGIPMIPGIKMLEAGAGAPDFSIKDMEGALFSLADQKGRKAVLLVFWSIFCEPCRVEMPVIQKVHDKYKDSGLEVAAVALDGEPLRSSIVGFVRQEAYTFRVLIDELDAKESFKVADPYGVAGTPTLYLVDRSGKVAFAKAGWVKEEELEKAIQGSLKK